MKFDPGSADGKPVALLFPGQGTQNLRAIGPLLGEPAIAQRYELVCDLLRRDPLRQTKTHPNTLSENAVSSLLTVLASSAMLDVLRRDGTLDRCIGVAGYSVGQWSALYAAGAIDAEQLLRTVHARATIMDRVIAAQASGMLAVIGVRENDLQSICARARETGGILEVANINAPSNYTLSGTADAIDFAEMELVRLRAKAVVRLPVSGGWHSSMLRAAVQPFRAYLDQLRFATPVIPVLDNTTGGWLSSDTQQAFQQLSLHLAMPVLWRQSMETLLQAGVQFFIEVGLGDTLSKFGIFISRKARYITLFQAQGVRRQRQ